MARGVARCFGRGGVLSRFGLGFALRPQWR
jgi:hypothetical protein